MSGRFIARAELIPAVATPEWARAGRVALINAELLVAETPSVESVTIDRSARIGSTDEARV